MPIRLRLAALFALGTAVVIVVASVVFVHLLSASLHATLDSDLRSRADAIASSPDALAATSANPGHAVTTLRSQGEGLAQIFNASGSMVASSPGAGDVPLLSQPNLARAQRGPLSATIIIGGASDVQNNANDSSHAGEPIRILANPVESAGGRFLIVVGASVEPSDVAVKRVKHAALVGGIPAVAIAAGGAWLLASAALRPVERMRRQVAEITEHDRQTALAVPATRDEIAALARTMNDLLVRLQDALERERGFVADAGHELRTPLAILRTELELASRSGRSHTELSAAVAAAVEETDRLARLAEDLLLLASTDGSDTLRREPTNLRKLLRAAVARVEAVAASHDVEVTLEAPATDECDLDADRVRQAVDNVIDNALRHAPSGTTVRIGAQQGPDSVTIEVRDAGPGFPEEFLPHAFERFRRADPARTRSDGGTGLGLAIVQSIARAHGGAAIAANAPDGGAVVRIELPTYKQT